MNYINLGLPSGTLWAESNEEGFYTFDEAVSKYGDSLPTKEQLEELTNHCQWEWVGNGYKVTGPNGNYIILPAVGYRNSIGNMNSVNRFGYYWSSAPYDFDYAWYLGFNSTIVNVYYGERCYGRSVRLINNKTKTK